MGTLGYLSPEQSSRPGSGRALGPLRPRGHPLRGAARSSRLQRPLRRGHDRGGAARRPASAALRARPAPSILDRVVRRCLQKDPDQRFHSAHDLALALEAVLDRPLAGAATLQRRAGAQPLPRASALHRGGRGRFFGREVEVAARSGTGCGHERLLGRDRPVRRGQDVVRSARASSRRSPTGWGALVRPRDTAPLQQPRTVPSRRHLAGDPEALPAPRALRRPGVRLRPSRSLAARGTARRPW